MKILHTMIRCSNLQKSINFYTQLLGMKLIRKDDYPDEKFTLAFLGYDDDVNSAQIELTYNYGVESYQMGNAFGHIALEVDDVYKTCAEIKSKGGNVTYGPAPMGGPGTNIIAFVADPDGYEIELIPKKD